MRNRFSGYLLAALLVLSSQAFAQSQNQGDGTTMAFLPQSDSPANLIETTHRTDDLLSSAKLQNRSTQRLTGYRIGWIAVYPTGKEKVGLGLPIDLPLGIAPGATIEVPAQHVSMSYAKEGAIAVIFFVTDIHTSAPSGATTEGLWNPTIDQFEQQALALTKSAILPTH